MKIVVELADKPYEMASFVLLIAFLAALRNVSCDTGVCPNCQAFHTKCSPGSEQIPLFGESCTFCDTVVNSEHRDIIPICELVLTSRSLWLRNYSLDHLSSTDVSHLKHLRHLYIEPGDLRYINNSTFDGFQNLYNLSLSRNKLTYLGKSWLVDVYGHLNLANNEIAFIEDDAFGAYDRCLDMVALHLPWNKLDVIESGYFRHLCSVILLDLRYNRIHTIDKGGFDDLHHLRVLRLAGNNLEVMYGLDNCDVHDQQNPNRFSQHTYETVEDQYDVIRDSQVEEDDVITPYGQAVMASAYGMDTTMTATASRSQMWTLDNCDVQDQQNPNRLSQHTYETVEDQYDVIRDSQVEEDDVITPYGQAVIACVYGMDTAMTATATSCAVCDTVVSSESRDIMPSCQLVQTSPSLWLRNYNLGHLSSADVSHLKHLRHLYVEPGDIRHLGNNTFDGFQHLFNLSLSRNKLTHIGKRWLVDVSGHLNLAHNEIAFIEDDAFGAYDRCLETRALHLPWNKLNVIDSGYFRHLCKVIFLDLRYNKIHTIDKGTPNVQKHSLV
ncbi:insulin-like growth factor-binding protein complex acid labile subunit [Branchiostoma lanceolatum]|uniref:insulin-like growth factor-binding protein complex acid labile subunit n=1 Tax=Branchiostoma lanceolatum TaxID=7740 RepID=UPI00345458D2